MKYTTAEEVHQTFLNFFLKKQHQTYPSSSILPLDGDNSLLFINSGMARLKPMFTGELAPPYKRLTNIQPCIRTVDMLDIGDARHGTSFRMMGNWSFADYFKKDAIAFAYELITDVFNIPKEKLYVSVFHNDGSNPLLKNIPSDDESMAIWSEYLPAERIIKCGPKDNFWQAGTFGPCGPCTEVFFDRGPEYGDPSSTEQLVDDRHIEIWNAGVFMQYFMQSDGTIINLPSQCVDAGAGLERFAMILQNVASIHEIDQYEAGYKAAFALTNNVRWARILLDHIKTYVLISREGIRPSNKDQGSVCRTLLRRVFTGLHMTGNNIDDAIGLLHTIAPLIDEPTMTERAIEDIEDWMEAEILAFKKVLAKSEKLLHSQTSNQILSPEDAFNMRSTHGVPIEFIKEYCLANSISFDYESYQGIEEQHRIISRNEV